MSFNFRKALRDGIKSARPYTYKLKKESYHKDTETEAHKSKRDSDEPKEKKDE